MRFSIISDERINETKGGILDAVDGTGKCSWENLPKVLLEFATTNAVFRENKRNNDSFISSEMVTIDFDKGQIDYKEVSRRTTAYGWRHYIFGSKNHMKDKNDGAGVIQRFHLYIPFSEPIKSVEDFRMSVDYIIENLCVNSHFDPVSRKAVQYWGKKSCLLCGGGEKDFDVDITLKNLHSIKERKNKELEEVFNKKQKRLERQRKEYKKIHGVDMPTPDKWELLKKTKTWKDFGVTLNIRGQRHSAACHIIGTMKKMDFEKYEIETFLLKEIGGLNNKQRDALLKQIDRLWRAQ